MLALGGTSYAAGVPVPVPAPAAPAYASVAVVPYGPHPTIQFDAASSSGLTAANFVAVAENTVCITGLKNMPRNLQVTSREVMLPAVQIDPKTGPCKGKQASISFYTADGNPSRYGAFYLSVVA